MGFTEATVKEGRQQAQQRLSATLWPLCANLRLPARGETLLEGRDLEFRYGEQSKVVLDQWKSTLAAVLI